MKLKWMIVWSILPVLLQAQVNTIDSLRRLLPSLKDSGRIDCLNKLSNAYYINALAETYIDVHTDTATFLATQALDESKKIQYVSGIADALQNIGEIARDRNDFRTAEKYFRMSVPLFEQLNEDEKSGWGNLTLGYSQLQQGRYAEAKTTYERALHYYDRVGNKEKQSALLRMISSTYSVRGYYETAFENTLKAIRITDQIHDARGVLSSPENMGNLYRDAGQNEIAISYYRMATNNAKTVNPVRYNKLMGDIANLLNKPDSAIYYYMQSHRYVTLVTNDSTVIKRDLFYKSYYIGDVYLKEKRYDSALEKFKGLLPFFENGNCITAVTRLVRSLARCYLGKENLASSFSYAKRLLAIAEETEARVYIRDAYELYWKIYDKQGKTDSAYKYNVKYIAIKDSIQTDEYRRNIALSEMRSIDEQQKTKISLLQKDQQLKQQQLSLQQEKIKSESVIKYILVGATLLLVLIAVFILRNINLKRKNEKQQLEHQLAMERLETQKTTIEFQQQASELEMQALRAQMNPHFIFNCLSSINRFILINKTEEASDYLTKFSRLIRMVLHNSEKPFITLESELEALRLYLDLERLRFKNTFDYSIHFVNDIDTTAIYVPPMLIQPFTENAIWHGLMHKKGMGQLDIDLSVANKALTCVITDNGIGRKMSASIKHRMTEKNKSVGVSITSNRLTLLNKSTGLSGVFYIEDLQDSSGNACGTRVVLNIPCKELAETASEINY
ncbi:MAG: histidine kinase [Agriterribacter sp.]